MNPQSWTTANHPSTRSTTSSTDPLKPSPPSLPASSLSGSDSGSSNVTASRSCSTDYIPNSIPLPLVSGQLSNFNPFYRNITIHSRYVGNDCRIYYALGLGDVVTTEVMHIPLQDILKHVSPLQLEIFETKLAREEAQARPEETRQLDRRQPPQIKPSALVQGLEQTLKIGQMDGKPRLRPRKTSPGTSSREDFRRATSDELVTSPAKELQRRKKRRRKARLEQPLEEVEEYEVEAILDDIFIPFKGSENIKNRLQYLVKWVGWPDEANTWEPVYNLAGAEELIEEYKLRKREKSQEILERNDMARSDTSEANA